MKRSILVVAVIYSSKSNTPESISVFTPYRHSLQNNFYNDLGFVIERIFSSGTKSVDNSVKIDLSSLLVLLISF
jgi:hypothetical protein